MVGTQKAFLRRDDVLEDGCGQRVIAAIRFERGDVRADQHRERSFWRRLFADGQCAAQIRFALIGSLLLGEDVEEIVIAAGECRVTGRKFALEYLQGATLQWFGFAELARFAI